MITASTLYSWAKCKHRVSLDRFGDSTMRDRTSSFLQMIWDQGVEFEKNVIANLKAPYTDLSSAGNDKERLTTEAMNRGDKLIYSGRISEDDLLGEPDILRKSRTKYVAIDIKSGSAYASEDDGGNGKPKKHYALQLALYTDILERKGMSVGRYGFIWDSQGRHVRYDFDKTAWKGYRTTLESVRAVFAGTQATMPGACGNCKQCVWYSYCDGELLKNDDLTLVRELGVTKRDEMYPRIKTVADLASAKISQFKSNGGTIFRGIGWDTLVKLQERAKRFNAKTPPSLTEPIKLPVNRRELFFDIEDDTFSGVCYLHGFVERMNHDNSTERYVSFIANTPDAKDEEQAFREAWEFLANATDAVVYYYSHHERTTYIKLSVKYPSVCSEADVKKLFDSDRVIDLLKIVGRSEWPTRDTSIKTLAKFAGFRWRDPHPSGAASMEWFRQWVDGGSVDAKNRILDYNEDDCRATRVVLDEIRKMSARL